MQSREEFHKTMVDAHNATIKDQLAVMGASFLILLPWIIAALLIGFGYPEWLF